MHHIFFPPRLDAVLVKDHPDSLPADVRDESSSDRLGRQKSHRPASEPFGWIRAGQRDHLLLLACAQLRACPRPGKLAQGRLQSPLAVPPTHPSHRRNRTARCRRDRLPVPLFMGQQQHPGTNALTRARLPSLKELLQLPALPRFQPNSSLSASLVLRHRNVRSQVRLSEKAADHNHPVRGLVVRLEGRDFDVEEVPALAQRSGLPSPPTGLHHTRRVPRFCNRAGGYTPTRGSWRLTLSSRGRMATG